MKYTFEIDGKTYEVKSSPLNCGLDTHEPVEYTEPTTAYASANVTDSWRYHE